MPPNDTLDQLIQQAMQDGGDSQPTTYQGLSPSDLLRAYQAGRIDAPTLKAELQGRKDQGGARIYSDAAIDEIITSARESMQESAGKAAVANNPANMRPSDYMNNAIAKEASAAAAPVANAQQYSDATEAWRPLVQRYFKPEDVDKALYVIEGESGGDPNATNTSSGAAGLFQILPTHGVNGKDPETAIKWAANQVYNVRKNWGDWGEGVTYNGEPFGILGVKPYNGSSGSVRSTSGTTSGSASGWNPSDVGKSIQNFLAWMQPRADQIGFKSATGLPSAFPGIRADIADMGQNFREQGLSPDMLTGFAALRGDQAVPSSDYFSKLGLLPTGGTNASPTSDTGFSRDPAVVGGNANIEPTPSAIEEALRRILQGGPTPMANGGTVGFAGGGSVSPSGRSFEQIEGTDYMDEAERAWWLREALNRGYNLGGDARSWLGEYEARAASPQAVAPAIQQLQNDGASAVASSRSANPVVQAAAANVATQQQQPSNSMSTYRSPNVGSLDSNQRSSIDNFLKWQQPRLDQLTFNARTGLPGDFPSIRVSLADLAQNFRTQGLEPTRLNGFSNFAGAMPVPSSDWQTKAGFAEGGSVEAYGNQNNRYDPYSTGPNREQGRPTNIDQLYNEAVTRFTGPYGTNVGLMGKASQWGGFQNLSNILNNLNSIGRDFQGQDLSAGYRLPGFNSLQNNIYQRIFRTAPPSNVQYANGGSAGMGGAGVATNPDGTPHLMLNEPATLIGNNTGTPYAVAGEVGTQEGVTPTPGGGLQFTPTDVPQTPMSDDVTLGREQAAAMKASVLAAVEQLLNGGNKRQRKGNYRPAPAGSTPAPSMLDSLMGAMA